MRIVRNVLSFKSIDLSSYFSKMKIPAVVMSCWTMSLKNIRNRYFKANPSVAAEGETAGNFTRNIFPRTPVGRSGTDNRYSSWIITTLWSLPPLYPAAGECTSYFLTAGISLHLQDKFGGIPQKEDFPILMHFIEITSRNFTIFFLFQDKYGKNPC